MEADRSVQKRTLYLFLSLVAFSHRLTFLIWTIFAGGWLRKRTGRKPKTWVITIFFAVNLFLWLPLLSRLFVPFFAEAQVQGLYPHRTPSAVYVGKGKWRLLKPLHDAPWQRINFQVHPCQPRHYLYQAPVAVFSYTLECTTPPMWFEQKIPIQLQAGVVRFHDFPLPWWQSLLRIPVLLEPDKKLRDALVQSVDAEIPWSPDAKVYRVSPYARERLLTWFEQARTTIQWIGTLTFLFYLLLVTSRGQHTKLHVGPSPFIKTIVAPMVGACSLAVAQWMQAKYPSGIPEFDPVRWTFPAVGPFGQSLGVFLLWGFYLLGWSCLISRWGIKSEQSHPHVFLRFPYHAISVWAWTFGWIGFTRIAHSFVNQFIRSSNPHFSDIWHASFVQYLFRLSLGEWLLGFILLAWSGTLYLTRRVPWKIWMAGSFMGILTAIILWKQIPLLIIIAWFLVTLTRAIESFTPFQPRLFTGLILPAWVLFYILQPNLIEVSSSSQKKFVETELKRYILLRQANIEADITSAQYELETRLSKYAPKSTRWLPSAPLLWLQTALGRNLTASALLLESLTSDGVRRSIQEFQWQVPWWNPPPIDWSSVSRWTERTMTMEMGDRFTLHYHERLLRRPDGWLRIGLGASQDLYWAPWDARPDFVPNSIRQAVTQDFRNILGPFQFGAWSPSQRAMTASTWFFPPPAAERSAPPLGWSRLTAWYGEPLDIYAFRSGALTLALAIHSQTLSGFIRELPLIILADGLTLMLLPLTLLLFPLKERRVTTFRRVIFRTIMAGIAVIGIVSLAGTSMFISWEYHEESKEQTKQTLNQAQAFIRDYAVLTENREIADTFLEWLSFTLFHDIDLFRNGYLLSSSRRSWYQLGLLPPYQAMDAVGLPEHAQGNAEWIGPGSFVQVPHTTDKLINTYRLSQLFNVAGFVGFLILGIGYVASLLMTHRIIEPIHMIRGQIQAIRTKHPRPLQPLPVPGEFQPFLQTLNDLIRAIQAHEQELRDRIEMMQRMLSHVREIVLLIRPTQDRILYWNETATQFFSWQPPLNLDHALTSKTPGLDVKGLPFPDWPSLWEKLRTSVQTVEKHIRWGNRWLNLWWIPLPSQEADTPEDDVMGLIIIQDLTAARQAAQLQAWKEMSRHVAHAIKNPLTPLQLYLDQIGSFIEQQRWELLGEKLPPILMRMQQNLEIIRRRVKEFSQYSRTIDAPITKQVFNITDIVRKVTQMYRVSNGPVIILKAPEEYLPVMGNEEMLERLVHNLIENSIEAAGTSVKIIIRLEKVPESKYVELWFKNFGPQIPPELMPRLFEPYFTTKQYGSGLGLALVKRYVDIHEGTVTVTNEDDGPLFRVHLPLVKSENDKSLAP